VYMKTAVIMCKDLTFKYLKQAYLTLNSHIVTEYLLVKYLMTTHFHTGALVNAEYASNNVNIMLTKYPKEQHRKIHSPSLCKL